MNPFIGMTPTLIMESTLAKMIFILKQTLNFNGPEKHHAVNYIDYVMVVSDVMVYKNISKIQLKLVFIDWPYNVLDCIK